MNRKIIKKITLLALLFIIVLSLGSCSFLESLGIDFGTKTQTTTNSTVQPSVVEPTTTTQAPTAQSSVVNPSTIASSATAPTNSITQPSVVKPTTIPSTTAQTSSTTQPSVVKPTTIPSTTAEPTTTAQPTVVSSSTIPSTTAPQEEIIENVILDNFQIHFLELGVYNTGDSTYIKAGDMDILIDAGAQAASALTIIDYVNDYCKDGVLEYVITTHAHDDHYTGMFGNAKSTKNFKGETVPKTGILYYYDIETIIDFSYSNNAGKSNYVKYEEAVTYAVDNGATHYTAEDCFKEENGGKKQFVLDEQFNITMDILYNKYYFELSSDENNHSVCTMFNYNDHHFMFTGDLEEDGEKALASYYDESTSEKTLPNVDLFKAGHHGSKTSSNDCLLDIIKPKVCCVCCCAGSSEYTNVNDNTFPTQEFINRIAKHTDRVYVTSLLNAAKTRETNTNVFESFNGTIIVSSDGIQIGLSASNNLVKLKDSQWFNEIIYVKINDKGLNTICSGLKKKDYYIASDSDVTQVTRRVWPN